MSGLIKTRVLLMQCCNARLLSVTVTTLEQHIWALLSSVATFIVVTVLQWRETASLLVKKWRWAGSCKFPTNSCKFPTEEIMGAPRFNLAPKFTQSGGLSAPNFVFLEESFWQGENFLTSWNLGVGSCPIACCHDAAEEKDVLCEQYEDLC